MNGRTHMTRRLGQALVLAVAVAALSVPVALGGDSPDAFEIGRAHV